MAHRSYREVLRKKSRKKARKARAKEKAKEKEKLTLRAMEEAHRVEAAAVAVAGRGRAHVLCATRQVILTAASVIMAHRFTHPKRLRQLEQPNMSVEVPAGEKVPAGQKARAAKAEVGIAREVRPRAMIFQKKSSNTNFYKSALPRPKHGSSCSKREKITTAAQRLHSKTGGTDSRSSPGLRAEIKSE